jgi:tetratricopeptide (TPR) repeat protein
MIAKNKQQTYHNLTVAIFITFLCFAVGISCSPINQKAYQELNKNVQNKRKMSDEYEKYVKRGEDFVAKKELQEAEQSFGEALKIAESEDWINEIVSVKTKLANVYMFEKKLQKSEALFNDAISTCETDNKCSSGRLDATFDFLSFLYLYQMKDVSKARTLISKIESSRIFASMDITKERVCYYIGEIKSAGFEKEAGELNNQKSCNQ